MSVPLAVNAPLPRFLTLQHTAHPQIAPIPDLGLANPHRRQGSQSIATALAWAYQVGVSPKGGGCVAPFYGCRDREILGESNSCGILHKFYFYVTLPVTPIYRLYIGDHYPKGRLYLQDA
jgi:hypothetical protein